MRRSVKMLKIIKFIKNRLFCDKGKHDWEYCTWGSALTDNLDGTHSLWEIPTRTCKTCGKHQFNLKNGWEKAKKGLTINDLK
jgi:hypothetical protein